MKDKYTALWVSHSSISDFLTCPRSYYLKNVYKDPKNNHKMKLMSPALALGQAVHEVLESLSMLRTEERFKEPLMERFDRAWQKISGKRGGFFDETSEQVYKKRGQEMMRRVYNHPGPVLNQAIKIQVDLPFYWLSEDENIILCGKIDWLEYLKDTDSVHIIDFKTGRAEENQQSLQLPIYHLLVHHCQQRVVTKASYWYLETDDTLTEKTLPSLEEAAEKVLAVARQIKLARQIDRMKCVRGEDGCFACAPYERILKGEGECVGADTFNADIFVLLPTRSDEPPQSVIL